MASTTREGFTHREFIEIVRDLSGKGKAGIFDVDDAIEWLRQERDRKLVREMREMREMQKGGA